MISLSIIRKLFRSKQVVNNVEKEVKSMNEVGWRTSIHGVIVGVLMLASIWAPDAYQSKIQRTALAFVAAGLIQAADAKNIKP